MRYSARKLRRSVGFRADHLRHSLPRRWLAGYMGGWVGWGLHQPDQLLFGQRALLSMFLRLCCHRCAFVA